VTGGDVNNPKFKLSKRNFGTEGMVIGEDVEIYLSSWDPGRAIYAAHTKDCTDCNLTPNGVEPKDKMNSVVGGQDLILSDTDAINSIVDGPIIMCTAMTTEPD